VEFSSNGHASQVRDPPETEGPVKNDKPARLKLEDVAQPIDNVLKQYPDDPNVPCFRLSGRRGGKPRMEAQVDALIKKMEEYVPPEQITKPFFGVGPGKIIHKEFWAAAAYAKEIGGGILVTDNLDRFKRPQAYDRWHNRNARYSQADLRALAALGNGKPLAILEGIDLKEDGKDGYHSRATKRTGKAGRPHKTKDYPGLAEKIFAKVEVIENGVGKRRRWDPSPRDLERWCKKVLKADVSAATIRRLLNQRSPWGPKWWKIFEDGRMERNRQRRQDGLRPLDFWEPSWCLRGACCKTVEHLSPHDLARF
jgi:hypothetical protein